MQANVLKPDGRSGEFNYMWFATGMHAARERELATGMRAARERELVSAEADSGRQRWKRMDSSVEEHFANETA